MFTKYTKISLKYFLWLCFAVQIVLLSQFFFCVHSLFYQFITLLYAIWFLLCRNGTNKTQRKKGFCWLKYRPIATHILVTDSVLFACSQAKLNWSSGRRIKSTKNMITPYSWRSKPQTRSMINSATLVFNFKGGWDTATVVFRNHRKYSLHP